MKLFLPDYKKWTFPDATTGIRLNSFNTKDTMLLDYTRESDLFCWLQILDSYKRHVSHWKKQVYIPYFPHARQDKVHFYGEPISLNLVVELLDRFGIEIFTIDPHAELFQLNIIDESSLLDLKFQIDNYGSICFSDKNAYSHGIFSLFRYTHKFCKPLIYFEKFRNKESGEISLSLSPKIDENDIKNKDILINDDICDGGTTFVLSAKALKDLGANKIDLFVTHGIFSQGLDPLYDAGISHIYTTNSYYRGESTEKLTVLNVLGECA